MQRVEIDALVIEGGLATGFTIGASEVLDGVTPGSQLVNAFWDPDRRVVLLDFRHPDEDPHLYGPKVITVRTEE